MNNTTDTKYLTQKQLAKRWGVDRTTLTRWKKEGKPLPPASNISGNSRERYAIDDVEAFEAAAKERAQGAPQSP